jgi:hypothetical protein
MNSQQSSHEYKRFLFLVIATDHPLTPSANVDHVWHLHLTYTHSYWDDLCARVLQRPLHHHPTQGRAQQRSLFKQLYRETLNRYNIFFGEPPADIWPSLQRRFQTLRILPWESTQNGWPVPRRSRFQLNCLVFSNRYQQKEVIGVLLILSLWLGVQRWAWAAQPTTQPTPSSEWFGWIFGILVLVVLGAIV